MYFDIIIHNIILKGGIYINSTNTFKKVDDTTKFWIHKIDDIDVLNDIHENKLIGAKKTLPKNFRPNDKILLFTTFNKRIQFFGYTMVDEVYEDNKKLYGYYNSKRKLKLKGVKYFTQPIKSADISKDLSFIKDPKRRGYFFRSEFKEISQEDFKFIFKQSSLTKSFPSYFEVFAMKEDEFILKTIKMLSLLLKYSNNRKQIEIKSFLVLLKKVLEQYDIIKSLDEVKEFYIKNVWKLGLKHNPSRDHEKSVLLYTSNGSKKNFSFISLE